MRKSKMLILVYLVLFSCIKEKSTSTESFIINNTIHKIEILPFLNGRLLEEDIKLINGNSTQSIIEQSNRGKGKGYGYDSYLVSIDSVQVVFDDSIGITHLSYYVCNKGSNLVGIRYDAERSIYNADNYVRKIIYEDKYNIGNEYYFTFVEGDYLDAAATKPAIPPIDN